MSDLVERLRDRAKRLGPSPDALLNFADGILPLLDEAATELASLRERVKELEGALYLQRNETDNLRDCLHEAVERCAKVADEATEQYMASAGFVRVNGRYQATPAKDAEDIQTKATAAAKSNASYAIAAAIRQLAAGKEKGDGE